MSASATCAAPGRYEPGQRDGPGARVRRLFPLIAERCELPTLPAVAMTALSLARDPETDVGELVRVVSADASLAARVLRISRSVVYARREPARSLKAAVLTIGFQALRKVIVAASARAMFADTEPYHEALWAHSLGTGLAARALASEMSAGIAEEAFLGGLLHDIGKTVLAMTDRAGYRELWEAAARGEQTFCELEQARYGFCHAAVGACLTSQWELDEDLVAAILVHHSDQEPPTTVALLLRAAGGLAEVLGLGGLGRGGDFEALAERAGIPAERLAAVGPSVVETFAEERGLFE